MGTSEPDKLPDIQERDIFLERVRLLHQEAHVAIFGAMVCIAAMVLFLSPVTELHLLIVWALAASATLVLRFVLADRFRRSSVGPAEAPRWMNTFRIGLLVTGIVWGSAGILLYPLDSVPHQVFISFLLGGMATGSVATYSALRGLSSLFVLPAMLPIAVKFLLSGEAIHTPMGIMVVVYAGILIAVSEGMYGTITTSLQLQFLNRELVSSLEESRNRAQALNAELIDEIASRTRTEKALRESEDRYRSIVDSALSGIVIIDDQYSITYANRESSEILGISVDRLVGSDFRNLLDEDTRRLVSDRYERRHRGEDPPPRYEIEFQRPGRESLQLELSATLVHDASGHPRTVAQIIDITERRRAEETMRMASRLEAIHTLAGGVAHDLNNLMAAVLGNAELLNIQHPGDERFERSLSQISQAARRAGELSQQLLGYARGGKYEPRALRLNDVLDEMLHLQESTRPRGVTFRVNLAPDLLVVEADASQMGQLVMNLLLNAMEAVGDLGTVTVTTRNHFVKELPSGSNGGPHALAGAEGLAPGKWVVLEVADDGHGMDEETMSRIFEPYFTTKPGGRGLGLAAAYGIVRHHGGLLTVNSKPDAGAVLQAYFPASDRQPADIPLPADEVPSGTETVLVVDDEESVREVLIEYLSSLGYSALGARNGEEALEVARSHEGDIHLTVLDMRMPVLDGASTFPILTNIRPETRVIICSGYELDSKAQALLDAGARAFLKKPVTIREFAQQIRHALDN